jgi:hypothetical protein
MSYRNKILNRLKSLDDIDGVSIELSREKKTVRILYDTQKSFDFYFNWKGDHFVGYFEDADSETSHAVISLWTPVDAINFSAAYLLLVQLRAMRPSPL